MVREEFKVHSLAAAKRRPTRRAGRGRSAVEVRTIADPLAWRTAAELADGDYTRLQPMADGSVRVLNHGRRRWL